MKYDYVVLACVVCAMAVLLTCVIVSPTMAVPAALGVVTTLVSAFRGKMVQNDS